MKLAFIVQGHPVPYQRPAQSAGGKPFPDPKTGAMMTRVHRYTDAKSAAYMATIGLHARIAVKEQKWPKSTLHLGQFRGPRGDFVVRLTFFRHAARGDLDNCIKACLDALTKACVWWDDGMVHEISAAVVTGPGIERTEIVVEMKGN